MPQSQGVIIPSLKKGKICMPMPFTQPTVVSKTINGYPIKMNDEKNVREIVCSFGNLYKAMRKCRQNVLWKDSVAGFTVVNGLANCYKIKHQHENGTYKIDGYTIFKVHEPKERTIVSTRIKDRVFQRSLCDNYLTEQVAKGFIYDSGACLPNKGTEFARKRFYIAMQRHYRKYGIRGGALKCDLSDYFGSTPHSVAADSITKRVQDGWAVSEVHRIIGSFKQGANPEKGIGLGSQASQLIQLAVLDEIDHYIKEVLRIKNYVRYMDDFILIHPNPNYLRYCKEKIRERVESLDLRLSPKKTQLQPITQPIHFLGFSFQLTETGKIVIKMLPEKVSHERRKLKKLVARAKAGLMTRKEVDACYESWRSHASGKSKNKPKGTPGKQLKRHTHKLVLAMDKYYKSLWEDNSYEVSQSQRPTAGRTQEV